MNLIYHVVVGIYQDSRRKSERSLLGLGPFYHRLMSVKSPKIKEIFSRVYYLFLALSNLYLVDELCKKKRKKILNKYHAPLLTRGVITGYFGVI